MSQHAPQPTTPHAAEPLDYAATYDAYWRREDRWGQHSFGDANELARRVMLVTGMGTVLDVGTGMAGLVFALLREGVDARGVDVAPVAVNAANLRAPGRFVQGSILNLPFADASFDTVVCTDVLEHLSPADVTTALRELARVAKKNVYIAVSTVADRDGVWHLTIQPRAWWEEQCFGVGLRKHPRAMRIMPYAQFEHEGASVTLVLEKLPLEAAAKWPLDALRAESQLHNDMLRWSGRRADAHVARYQYASELVRPGDSVLDASCGLGYGSSVLATNSLARQVVGVDIDSRAIAYANDCYAGERTRFVVGDATKLAQFADASVDFITCFETLEHVHDPRSVLAEFQRILSPGGRIIASVPNDWTDASGRDPNPHHLHVYTWQKLIDDVRASGDGWIIERATRQTAGGGMKLSDQPRLLESVALDDAKRVSSNVRAEWWLITLMKDPLAGSKVGYRETVFPAQAINDYAARDGEAYHLTNFARDYDNPWLVRSMVAMGMRLSDDAELVKLATRVLERARPGSADHGAAVCVLLYATLLNKPSGSSLDDMTAESQRFANNCDGSAHSLRWLVSNQYAAALLAQSRGNVLAAREAFTLCAKQDTCVFSPLLATKTIDAAWRAGMLAAQAGELDAARAMWQHGVRECKRVMSGSWLNAIGDEDAPQLFAFAELAQVMDAAAKCGRALAMGDRWLNEPSIAMEVSRQSLLVQAQAGWTEARRIATEWQQVATQLRERETQFHDLRFGLEAASAREAILTRDRDVWLAESKRLEREWSEQSRRVQALAAKVDGLFAEVNQAARDRDNWQHEAQRIAREWEAVAEQLQVTRSHGDAMAAHARGLERERDDVVGRVTELVAENEVQQAELTKLLARLQTAHLSAAHFRALFEAIRGEADGLEARRAFRLARTLGLVDPIYTGKSAATLDGANGSIGGHA